MTPPTGTPEVGFVCESRAMRRFVTELEHAAASDVPVLIWGEPGVGKERAARALHERSGRGTQPLEVIRCSGLDGAALQAALADVVPRARSGSVLLDGVEELGADAQAELLRVVQSPLAVRSSGFSPRRLRQAPRWISNAAADLDPLVRRGRLRRDLFHRLAVVRLHLPPLRARKADLPALAAEVLTERSRSRAPCLLCEEEALARLGDYPWPGNVRELEGVLLQAGWRARDGVLRAADLKDLLSPAVRDAAVQIPAGDVAGRGRAGAAAGDAGGAGREQEADRGGAGDHAPDAVPEAGAYLSGRVVVPASRRARSIHGCAPGSIAGTEDRSAWFHEERLYPAGTGAYETARQSRS